MDLNCELCANKKECFDNHWCVTMDRGRKINNEYICDNFELSGRKYEELKEKNKKLEDVIDMMAEDISNSDIDEHTNKQEIYDSTLDMMYDEALDIKEEH